MAKVLAKRLEEFDPMFIEELVLEENKTPHNRKNPVGRHKDGSVAEW